ncbi:MULTISPECIES: hypothetical protein [unclassified Nostoc]|uniref:hypothetical protein n=1 Tax=unclassified Nostoc TaxID=2593658 RepID=UPI0013D07F94|nr:MULTISPECIES: hypothetical protein [unclassified Nostoc]MBE9003095.1 hypothetical protein [Nostoc sp. LEGE 12447]NEU78731.1 hypothetical protein [Nostoc sp. UIC 10630]
MTYYFHVFDAHKNGVLGKPDFDKIVNGVAKTYNIVQNSEIYHYISSTYGKRWDALAKEADTNADNKASLDEWLSYQYKLLNYSKSDFLWLKIASMFYDIQDIDKDGVILRERLR